VEFWTSVKVVLRRWYVVLPALLLTAALSVALINNIKPSYRATGSVVLLRTQPPPNTNCTNPYDCLDYQSTQLASVIAIAATDQSFASRLVAAGASPTYTVTGPSNNNGQNPTPVVSLTETARSEATAMKSYEILTDQLNQVLSERQRSVGIKPTDPTFVSAVALTAPQHASRLIGTRVKALVVVITMGVILAIALAFAVDSAASARKRRRRDDRRPAAEDDLEGGVDDETVPDRQPVNGSARSAVVGEPDAPPAQQTPPAARPSRSSRAQRSTAPARASAAGDEAGGNADGATTQLDERATEEAERKTSDEGATATVKALRE